MRVFAAAVLLCAAASLPRARAGDFATCDEEYECIYQASIPPGITFSFDLRPLCELGTTYTTTVGFHTYSFNICGTSSFECVPQWTNVYQTGVAVQYWGSVPPCNATTPNCTDYLGNNVCCTQNCQVLGTGFPNWQLKDPQNPESGGVRLTHVGVPPAYVNTCCFLCLLYSWRALRIVVLARLLVPLSLLHHCFVRLQ